MTSSRKTKPTSIESVRCAVYTRKSTEEGLDQDFNSLDAQREAAEAYIHSQAHAGWTALSGRYDDGGYSGSNLDRPANILAGFLGTDAAGEDEQDRLGGVGSISNHSSRPLP